MAEWPGKVVNEKPEHAKTFWLLGRGEGLAEIVSMCSERQDGQIEQCTQRKNVAVNLKMDDADVGGLV